MLGGENLERGLTILVSEHGFGKPKGYEQEFGKSRAFTLET